MAVSCGNCKGRHETSADVKACFTASRHDHRPTTQHNGPSDKQVTFMLDLQEGRVALDGQGRQDEDGRSVAEVLEDLKPEDTDGRAWREDIVRRMDRKSASAYIDSLMASPKVKRSGGSQPADLEDGIYEKDGIIYKVVHAVHGSGKQYAKELRGTSWEYAGRKPLHTLTADDKLSAEKAKAWGILYGMCINCMRTLTREESIHVGYGPVCAANHGWWYPTKSELQALTLEGVSA